MKFYVIVASDENRGIGIEGKLPWRLPSDLKEFKKITTTTKNPHKQNALIMGRKTWESIPKKFRPLPGRFNIVLTRNADYMVEEGIELVDSFEEALHLADDPLIEKAFVIGGAHVFERALIDPDCGGIYLTEILSTFRCDTFLSAIDSHKFKRVKEGEILEENDIKYRFVEYEAT